MKQAIDVYEQLKDSFFYSLRSYLRIELSRNAEEEALCLLAGASFLFDNLFAKQDAGKEITRASYEDLKDSYDAKKLSEAATKIRLGMVVEEFAKGNSPFHEYFTWLANDEEIVLTATKDKQGMLVLSLTALLSSLVLNDKKDEAKTRVSEILFLNVTETFLEQYKALYKEEFLHLASVPFFVDVESAFERIRKEMVD